MDMPVEKKIVFELNGRSVEAIEGETILEAADRIGVEIPPSLLQGRHSGRWELQGLCGGN